MVMVTDPGAGRFWLLVHAEYPVIPGWVAVALKLLPAYGLVIDGAVTTTVVVQVLSTPLRTPQLWV
jgi:hypothetical protein